MFNNTSVLHSLFQFLPYSPITSSNFMDSLFSPLSPFSAGSTRVYGCKAICWSMGSLSVATSLKKISPSSLSSYQLPIAHQLRVGYIVLPQVPKHVGNVAVLCQQRPCSHAAGSSVQWYCCVLENMVPYNLGLSAVFLCLTVVILEPWEERSSDVYILLKVGHPHSLLFSALWPDDGYVHHHNMKKLI